MKPSPFPIYERMALAGQMSLATRPAFIDASEALREHKRGVDLEGYGPVMPPFESLWIEGQDFSQDGQRYPVAFHVEMDTPAFSVAKRRPVAGHRISAYAIVDGRALESRIGTTFTLDDDGGVGSIDPSVRLGKEHALDSMPQERIEELCWYVERHARLVFFVLSLMHCRNVEQRKATYTPTPRRRKSDRVRPSIEYRTIRLPKPSQRGGAGASTGAVKLHTARGHFKTYTEDAPLMGRHVGTYYWAAQVRGSRENGEVVSSYAV